QSTENGRLGISVSFRELEDSPDRLERLWVLERAEVAPFFVRYHLADSPADDLRVARARELGNGHDALGPESAPEPACDEVAELLGRIRVRVAQHDDAPECLAFELVRDADGCRFEYPWVVDQHRLDLG